MTDGKPVDRDGLDSGRPHHYLIFSALALPSMGGVELFTDNLARELVRMGNQVTIVTNNLDNLPLFELLAEGLEIVRFPCHPLLQGRFPIPKKDAGFKTVYEYLLKGSYSGILINTRFYPHSIIGLNISRKLELQPILLDHGSAYLTLGNKAIDGVIRLYEHAITARAKHLCDNFYGISRKSSEWLKTFGITAKGIISNAIDAEAFRQQASKRSFRQELDISDGILVIAFVGRLVPEKGIPSLISAMGKLVDLPIVLLIAGDGPLRTAIDQTSNSHVYTLGRLNRQDTAALLLEADLLCLPSRSEGFSTTLLEASACETPSLVTDVGGAREIIPNDSFGILLDSNSPDNIESGLRYALDQKDSLKDMGAKAGELVEQKYTWRSTALSFIEATKRLSNSRQS